MESQHLSAVDVNLEETEKPCATKKSKLIKILKCSSKDSDEPQVITPSDKVGKGVHYYIDTPYLDVENDPLQWMKYL